MAKKKTKKKVKVDPAVLRWLIKERDFWERESEDTTAIFEGIKEARQKYKKTGRLPRVLRDQFKRDMNKSKPRKRW